MTNPNRTRDTDELSCIPISIGSCKESSNLIQDKGYSPFNRPGVRGVGCILPPYLDNIVDICKGKFSSVLFSIFIH